MFLGTLFFKEVRIQREEGSALIVLVKQKELLRDVWVSIESLDRRTERNLRLSVVFGT